MRGFPDRLSEGRFLCWNLIRIHICWNIWIAACRLTAGEQVTKSKYWIYVEKDIFHYRYLLRLIEGRWMIDNAQWCRRGQWGFCGL